MMSEEELLRPSNQTNFKVEVKGQVQVLVHLHCAVLNTSGSGLRSLQPSLKIQVS